MRCPSDIQGYRNIDHPLAQILAAGEFYGAVEAFVVDMWTHIYSDDPPDEEEVAEAISPLEMLAALGKLGLRFETEVPFRKDDPLDDDYQHFNGRVFGGGVVETLLQKWAFDVMDQVDLDHRAFFQGLTTTDLIFVPDDGRTVDKAYELYVQSMRASVGTHERYRELEAHGSRLAISEDALEIGRKGAGPSEKRPVLIDRIALALRDAGEPLTADQVAGILKHPNVPSVTSALHEAAVNRRPKRIAGWIKRDPSGKGYSWVP